MGIYQNVSCGQGGAAEEQFRFRAVAGAGGLEMGHQDPPITPVRQEQGLLIARREARAIPESHPDRRTGTHVVKGRQAVRVPGRPLARAIPPAEFAPAGDETKPGGAVPRCVHVILHVRVKSDQLPLAIEGRIIGIAEPRGDEFPVLSLRIHPVETSARREHIGHESPRVRQPGQQVILTPNRWDPRMTGFPHAGRVARDYIYGLAFRIRQQGMPAVIAPSFQRLQQFHLIQLIVAPAAPHPVQPAVEFPVFAHQRVEAVERPHQALGTA